LGPLSRAPIPNDDSALTHHGRDNGPILRWKNTPQRCPSGRGDIGQSFLGTTGRHRERPQRISASTISLSVRYAARRLSPARVLLHLSADLLPDFRNLTYTIIDRTKPTTPMLVFELGTQIIDPFQSYDRQLFLANAHFQPSTLVGIFLESGAGDARSSARSIQIARQFQRWKTPLT